MHPKPKREDRRAIILGDAERPVGKVVCEHRVIARVRVGVTLKGGESHDYCNQQESGKSRPMKRTLRRVKSFDDAIHDFPPNAGRWLILKVRAGD